MHCQAQAGALIQYICDLQYFFALGRYQFGVTRCEDDVVETFAPAAAAEYRAYDTITMPP